jgi:NADPH:quinone reductase-like Zn-dependent oxidoreductase
MTQKLMKAVLLRGYGDVNQLNYEDTPIPMPAAGEVLVKTIAVSVNPIDWKLRRGDLREIRPLEFPAILGRDLSGEVVALGEGVDRLKVGERVFGLVNRTYAEYVVCKPEEVARIPEGLDGIGAASRPVDWGPGD